ncbi:helix-turn-helix transcriptional regulator [Streptomyces sp. H27-G5]|uniref:helix-turn-helix transcriptional regulator n=1 Tax=Streptomyces sp. H27-G5 TaxID=2996698 RepID=UPI00226FDC9F|nr:helix-turn-helix transcriptional regulator [Streptomyces sp. H27-G5]MCY0922884.1 helix-turn-helix transcriptional regulator [Streptomyces sp. H27-G5]
MGKKLWDKPTALFRAITRGKNPPQTESVDGILGDLEGAGVSPKTIAQRLGVGERTVKNWREGKSKPKAQNFEKLQDTVRTSPEIRRQSLAPLRESRMRNQGSYVRMTAKIGSDSPGADKFNGRTRTIGADKDHPLHLTAEQLGTILDAYGNGDDEAAMEAFREAVGEQYYGGFEFEDVTNMEFIRDYDGERPEM